MIGRRIKLLLNINITDEDITKLEQELGGNYSFDIKRRKVLKNFEDIQACPGSGKTTMVAAKLILLAKKWTELNKGICVLTHTNVAKGEIIRLLISHPAGHKLLSYPHFVGTIQDFVDKFLGIPYSKTQGWEVRLRDSDEFVDDCLKLDWRIKVFDKKTNKKYWFLYYVNRKIINFSNFTYYFHEGNLCLNDIFIKSVNNNINLEADYFENRKRELCDLGYFQYKEMYAFAEKLLCDNDNVKESVQLRFPIVIVDEMQDTQQIQDHLINKIFSSNNVILQRFGDPDQAIFHGLYEEEPNDSYNNNKTLFAITDSHRFGNDIANKIKGLSYNRLKDLKSTKRELDAKVSHTIFIYNQKSIQQVLHEYGALVLETLKQPELRKVVKAVGAVGKDNPDGLTIRHYWNEYDKAKSIKSFKAIRFIHILKKCYDTKSGNVSENYELLIQGVINLLRKANKKTKNEENKDVFYNKTTLKKELKANSKYNQFRDLLTSWILDDFPDQNNWEKQRNKLQELMDLKSPLNQETEEFLAYDHQFSQNEGTQESIINRFQCNNGVDVEVGTIHSVKGETHDATLIMETKYYKNDISSMLDYFINDDLDAPTEKSRKAGFMRRLYVAASRPRHLLCLALNKEHITPDQIEALEAKGWHIKEINP